MTNPLYTVLSRQSALMQELNAVANNIANADTVGYRAERAFYSEYVQALDPAQSGPGSLSQTRIAGQFFNAETGSLIDTGGVLDIAIEGEGFFLVETPAGQRLTRAGAFALDQEGGLSTSQGAAVLSEAGAQIAIPLDASTITIAADGTVAADGQPAGRLAVVNAPQTALRREGDNLFVSETPPTPVLNGRVRQGFLEDSNAKPVLEMTRLIEIQRAYETGQQLIAHEDDRIQQTIQALGAR